VFVTPALSSDGSLSGLVGADLVCQLLARASTLGGTWKAWLSDGSMSPETRFAHAAGPYRLLDRTTVAADWAGLTSGQLLHAISIEPSGSPAMGSLQVWTGTDANGTITQQNCTGWRSNASTLFGTVGAWDQTDARWTNAQPQGFNLMRLRLYCFEQ